MTVSATASDNVGVAGVKFLVDGAALGAEDTPELNSSPTACRGTPPRSPTAPTR